MLVPAGTPGATVEAAFQADGVSSRQTAIIPATFRFRAQRLSFTISQAQDGGELSATVVADERKWATLSHDGVVHLQELSRYMNQRVLELSGGKQMPVIERPRGVRSFPLAKPQTTGGKPPPNGK